MRVRLTDARYKTTLDGRCVGAHGKSQYGAPAGDRVERRPHHPEVAVDVDDELAAAMATTGGPSYVRPPATPRGEVDDATNPIVGRAQQHARAHASHPARAKAAPTASPWERSTPRTAAPPGIDNDHTHCASTMDPARR